MGVRQILCECLGSSLFPLVSSHGRERASPEPRKIERLGDVVVGPRGIQGTGTRLSADFEDFEDLVEEPKGDQPLRKPFTHTALLDFEHPRFE